jgi:hypothetical protein
LKGVRSGVEKVLKDRRSPRERGRTGTSVKKNKRACSTIHIRSPGSSSAPRTSPTSHSFVSRRHDSCCRCTRVSAFMRWTPSISASQLRRRSATAAIIFLRVFARTNRRRGGVERRQKRS